MELEAESEEEVNGKEMNNYDVKHTCIPLRLLNCVDGLRSSQTLHWIVLSFLRGMSLSMMATMTAMMMVATMVEKT